VVVVVFLSLKTIIKIRIAKAKMIKKDRMLKRITP
jgi:hypothetical protein